MTENIITDVKTAKAVVRHEKGRNTIVYSDYIAANGVTVDTVTEHARALRELAYPNVKPSSRADRDTVEYKANAFWTRVRNGLNDNLGVSKKKKNVGTENLLTGHGIEALMGKSNDEILKAIVTELFNRTADNK